MDFNDINTYCYYSKHYAFGWMVFHIEDNEEVMDMCFSREKDATSFALSLNMREAKRVADVKERLETAHKNLVVPSNPYYSITGYYGD